MNNEMRGHADTHTHTTLIIALEWGMRNVSNEFEKQKLKSKIFVIPLVLPGIY